jgi:hypothetical protein
MKPISLMRGSGIEPWMVQQVVLRKAPQEITSVTQACKIVAREYGVTPETLRCYASQGVPAKSKLVKRILQDYAIIEAENFSGMLT